MRKTFVFFQQNTFFCRHQKKKTKQNICTDYDFRLLQQTQNGVSCIVQHTYPGDQDPPTPASCTYQIHHSEESGTVML